MPARVLPITTSPIARCTTTERAWLKFLDGWLARAPMSAMSEAAE
jgi:hypothetical protein